jgi:hypothetical protein
MQLFFFSHWNLKEVVIGALLTPPSGVSKWENHPFHEKQYIHEGRRKLFTTPERSVNVSFQ